MFEGGAPGKSMGGGGGCIGFVCDNTLTGASGNSIDGGGGGFIGFACVIINSLDDFEERRRTRCAFLYADALFAVA